MKRTRKLILALVVVMSLLMAMAVAIIPASAATSKEITVYFENNWNWSDVRVYAFNNNESATMGNWPGTQMTSTGKTAGNGATIYKATIPSGAKAIIFNGVKDDGSGNRDQSPNITSISDCTVWYMSWDNGNKCGTYSACDAYGLHAAGSAATCTTAQTCVACGKQVAPALGHDFSNGSTCGNGCGTTCTHKSYTDNVVDPTCTDGGYTRHTCQSCGYFYDTDPVAANGHSFVDGKCSVCGVVRVYYSGTLTNVHAYIWNSEGIIASWPGTAIPETNKVNGVYYVDVPDGYDNIIFNNGNGGDSNQTADLKVPTDANVIFNGSEWVAHIGGDATCTEQAECTVCGEKYGDALGHSATCGHAAEVNGQFYDSIQNAITAAENGDTVKLAYHVTVKGNLLIGKEITLDLNGQTLTVNNGGIVSFHSNTKIVDNGKTKGIIKVAQGNLVLAEGQKEAVESAQVPVWNGEGYVIAGVVDQYKKSDVVEDGKVVIEFRPAFEGVDHYTLFKDGVEDNDLTFKIRVTVKENDVREYLVPVDVIKAAYTDHLTIKVSLANANLGTTYTIELLVEYKYGVTYVGKLGVVENGEYNK